MDILIEVIILVSIWIIFVLLKNYLPSYMDKKGENLATKQDISRITELVEAVKLDFSKRSELLLKKREAYEKITSGMRVFIQGHEATDLQKDAMLDAYSTAWLWANDDVVMFLNEHLNYQIQFSGKSGSVNQEALKQSYVQCILAMRKDVGYENTELESKDFVFVKF